MLNFYPHLIQKVKIKYYLYNLHTNELHQQTLYQSSQHMYTYFAPNKQTHNVNTKMTQQTLTQTEQTLFVQQSFQFWFL